MRTAEDYVKMYADFRNDLNMTDSIRLLVETVRKEAIIEAANRAKIKWNEIEYNEEKRDYDYEPEIDKQSILSLINELK